MKSSIIVAVAKEDAHGARVILWHSDANGVYSGSANLGAEVSGSTSSGYTASLPIGVDSY